MSMKLANDIQQLQIQIEQTNGHVANLRQVVDNLTGVVQRLEKEAGEDRALMKELIQLKGALILSTTKATGPKNVRGKEAK